MEQAKFIKTTDIHTAQKLVEAGFTQVQCAYGVHVFLNESGQMNFEKNNIDKSELIFSDMLFL